MMKEGVNQRIILYFILISAIIRAFLAYTLDLGNDEVYYYMYSLYPSWSYFDHPPMISWVIRLFTFNNLLHHIFFIRLASIVFTSFSTWIVYLIARKYGTYRGGLLAVILFTASIYNSIITGVFILPDTPQVFFWFLALYCFSEAFETAEIQFRSKMYVLAGGLFTGLSILSKYTSVFIWLGVIGFVLLYRKQWLKSAIFYFSILMSVLLQFPVLIWNLQNHFISFTYQGNRVSGLSKIRPDYFFTEITGEFLYNNPVNFILIIVSLILVFYYKRIRPQAGLFLILFVSVPLILTFWFLSFFHSTLPHWTGPGFSTLIIFTAVIFDKVTREKPGFTLIPQWFRYSLILSVFIIILGFFQINNGILTRLLVPAKNGVERVDWDISLDMYGWKQLKEAMPGIYYHDLSTGRIGKDPFLISWRWFPSANLDYYVARPLGLKLLAFGKMSQIHQYHWINRIRGGFPYGKDAYFICSSRDKKNPGSLFRDHFELYGRPDTVPVMRAGRQVMEFYVYRLKNYKVSNPLTRSFFAGQPIR
ncbi:MAG: ArnT family glycosyltransferase [Bacteroidales bacterium]